MTSVNVNNLEIQVNESGHVTFTRDGVTWKFREGFQPRLECEEGILNFEDALSISRDVITSGVGEGIRSHYEGFKAGNQTVPYSFDTIVWVEAASSDVFCLTRKDLRFGRSIGLVRWSLMKRTRSGIRF